MRGDEKSEKRVQSFLISRLGNLITSNRITLISNHQPLNKHAEGEVRLTWKNLTFHPHTLALNIH